MIVDWSASGTPKTGRDSIWICAAGRDGAELLLENPPTRHAAKALLRELLADSLRRGDRVLAGFDFPFGYPAGFAVRLGLAGNPPWRAVWDEISSLLADDARNRNNRFDVGATFNRRVSGGRFPFWGCPASKAGPFLGPRHHRFHAGENLAEKRLIDTWMIGAQPCWKLAYAGSVGGQVLTGIPVVRALRDDPDWADRARVWPFETGFSLPDEARIVLAEIWPSWWTVRPELGPPNDRAQVRTVAGIFAEHGRTGELMRWLAGPGQLTERERLIAQTEEAWTLGVMSPRNARKTPSPPAMPGKRVGVRGACAGPVVADLRPAAADVPATPGSSPGRVLSCGAGEGNVAFLANSSGRAVIPAAHDADRCPLPNPPPLAGEGRVGVQPRKRSNSRTPGISGPAGRPRFDYLRDPAAIYRRSFAMVREAADLGRFPAALRPLAVRLAHAAGDVSILDDLAWSRGAVGVGRRALANGAPILADSAMVASGIAAARLPAGNPVICTLREPAVPALASELRTTRSAAAVELWRLHLAGAIVAIGNAPTALFHLLEILAAGAAPPALVLGFPVGFVGAAEAKEALIGFGSGLPFIALRGRRGGSALAAASVNALCAPR